MSTRVILTGASGHIGFHVAKVLLQRGYAVDLLLRAPNVLTRRLERAGAAAHVCDLLNPGGYQHLFAEAGGLFHLAASNTTSQREAAAVRQSTAGLTEIVVGAALQAGVPKIVYTSSVVVLGRSEDPHRLINEADTTASAESPYVRGKRDAEQFCLSRNEAGADIRIMYPSWVVGPDDPKATPPHKLILDFVTKGQRFYFEGGISIAHVEEVAEAHVAAFERGAPRGRYVIGGANISFQQFYTLLAQFSGRKAPKLLLPKPVMMALAKCAKLVFEAFDREAPVDPKYVDAIVGNYSWYDSTKAIDELDYRIRPAEESLSEAVLHARMRTSGTYQLNLHLADAKPTGAEDEGLLLITGVPGWLGNRLLDMLINGDSFGNRYPPRKVRLLVHPSFQELLQLPSHFEIVYSDINDPVGVRQAVSGVSTVFHLAGAIWPRKAETLYHVNVDGTKNLVDACVEKGVRRVLFMSTDSTCGHGTAEKRVFDEQTDVRPYRDYGISKRMAEEYLLGKAAEGHLDPTILRGFWFFGPYAPPRQLGFIRMFSWPRQLVFGNGKNLRSITHVDNAVDAFFKAEKTSATHSKWYWVGDGQAGQTVDSIYETVAKTVGRPYRPFYVPVFVCQFFSVVDAILRRFGRIHPTIYSAAKFHLDIAGTSEAAIRDFGYAPRVTLADGAREMHEMSARV